MDASLLDELQALLPGRVTTDPVELSLHARDFWPRLVMAERRGEELPRPAAVAAPKSTEEVSRLLAWSNERGVRVVPFGAGTGVCGGASADREAVTLDLKRLDRVLGIDDVSGTVTVQPGIIAQALENHLAHRGWTLGHFPSSIHCSTVGGFLAIRSAGQTSSGHGKLEDRVVALEVVLADGSVVRTRAAPSSAAGPDLTRLFLGAEGTTGVITEATLRLTPRPESVLDHGLLFSSFAAGLDAIRRALRTGVTPTVFRLYDEADTALVFGSQDREAPDGCLAVFGVEGEAEVARFVHDRVLRELVAAGGEDLGPEPGEHWRRHRHDLSYRFADYLKPGGTFGDAVALDTMEVATVWSRLPSLYEAVRDALAAHSDLVLAHASHVYPEGAAIYFTFGAAAGGDEDAALARYDAAWDAGQRAALAAGGTISHHHGVGLLRVPWLREELGDGGYAVLTAVKAALDPGGMLNPGTLGLGSRS
ncbi:MAG: FAD-binding oxidoreductase [Nitriliruptorales bacterium]